jgi:hypothetical protein
MLAWSDIKIKKQNSFIHITYICGYFVNAQATQSSFLCKPRKIIIPQQPQDMYKKEKKVKPERYYITCYYRKLDEEASAFIYNRLTAYRSGSDIIHCEMLFENDNIGMTVDSINNVMFFDKIDYDPAKWEGNHSL